MCDAAAGIVCHPPACDPHAAAEIRVLPIEEERLVESAHRVERVPPDQHAGARYPVDVNRLAHVRTRLKIAAAPGIGRPRAREPRAPAAEHRRPPRKRARGCLDCSIARRDEGCHEACLRVRVHPRAQPWDDIGRDGRVGVEHQKQVSVRELRGPVDSRTESRIVRGCDEPYVRMRTPQSCDRGLVACVIDDDAFEAER